MTEQRWIERLLSTTRGRVLTLLRREARTVPELAEALDVTDNAVRTHVSALERDGMVETASLRREGVGQPARVYRLVPEAEEFFPKGYAAVLSVVVSELEDREGRDGAEELLRAAGRRAGTELGAGADFPPEGEDGLKAALAVLEELGGAVEPRELDDGSTLLEGHGCPLSAVVGRHPGLCGLVEALLEEVAGVPVEERCDRDADRPRCAFRLCRCPEG